MKRLGNIIVILVLCLWNTSTVMAQKLAFKTNVLSDVLMAPSLGAELVISDRWSVDMTVMGTPGSFLAKKLSLTAIQPEIRYWYAGRALTRGFVGFALSGAMVKGELKSTWYNGFVAGGGLTFGYVFHLTKHFDVEGSMGTGLYMFRRKTGGTEAACDVAGFENKMVFLPSKVGISLVYIFK